MVMSAAPWAIWNSAGWQLSQSSHSVCAWWGNTTLKAALPAGTSATSRGSVGRSAAAGSRPGRGAITPSASALVQSAAPAVTGSSFLASAQVRACSTGVRGASLGRHSGWTPEIFAAPTPWQRLQLSSRGNATVPWQAPHPSPALILAMDIELAPLDASKTAG
jgi:hypothetical protein